MVKYLRHLSYGAAMIVGLPVMAAAQGIDADVSIGLGGGGAGVDANVDANVGGVGADADVDANVGGGGAAADADVRLGGNGGNDPSDADVDADVRVGGPRRGADANVAVGVGRGDGANATARLDLFGPGGLFDSELGLSLSGGGAAGPGGADLDPERVAEVFNTLPEDQRQAARRQCQDILANPAGFDRALSTLCAAVARL